MLPIITILIIISSAFSYLNLLTMPVLVLILIVIAGKTNNPIAKTIVTLDIPPKLTTIFHANPPKKVKYELVASL